MFCSLNTTLADIGLHLSFCLPVCELSAFSFALHTKLSPIKYLTHIFFINLDESCFYFKMFFYIFCILYIRYNGNTFLYNLL